MAMTAQDKPKYVGLIAVVIALGLTGCATKETVVKENPERRLESADPNSPLQVTEETVILDARPAFDYTTAHIPRSIPIQWSDFSERENAQRGVLQNDLFAIARRLARIGIQPTTKVVVVGQGLQGEGEEGRIAWMLAYLGIKDVRFADIKSFKGNLTTIAPDASKNAPIWKPELEESLNVTRAEVQYVINNQGTVKPVAFGQGGQPTLYRIIDVRSSKEYMGKAGLGPVPNIEAINIPWKEFFTPLMRPNQDIATQLQSVGILPEHRIIVLEEDGVSSAAVTMALRALGYKNAGNYAGGWVDLMSAYPKKNGK